MNIVINNCHGGYSLSIEAVLWLFEHGYDEEGFKTPVDEYFGYNDNFESNFSKHNKLLKWKEYLINKKEYISVTPFTPDEKFVLNQRPNDRSHSLLVECVKVLGERANGRCAELKIVEIPDDVEWEIEEYDGLEWVSESHRTWT